MFCVICFRKKNQKFSDLFSKNDREFFRKKKNKRIFVRNMLRAKHCVKLFVFFDKMKRFWRKKKNWTIREGQKIIIENNKSKIQVLIEGIALNSAMAGDYVDVLNKSTGKPIKAWVKNNKKVSIFR